MAEKKIRYFIFDDTLPADFPKGPSREISFQPSYISHFTRVFRSDLNGDSRATLIPKLNAVEFGYCVVVSPKRCLEVEAVLSKTGFIRTRSNVGYGECELGPAFYYILENPGKVNFPLNDTRKRIAVWMNQFWPRYDDLPYTYIEIPMR